MRSFLHVSTASLAEDPEISLTISVAPVSQLVVAATVVKVEDAPLECAIYGFQYHSHVTNTARRNELILDEEVNVERERNDHVAAMKADTLKLIVQSPKAPKLLSPFLDEHSSPALEQTSIDVPICSLTRFRFALNSYRYFSLIAAASLAFNFPENSNTKRWQSLKHFVVVASNIGTPDRIPKPDTIVCINAQS
ncbi:hypothetical protein Tco_1397329 [Tanacetum coccineum]